MTQSTHRFIETNGIHMHIAEQGTGPLVPAASRFSRAMVLLATPICRGPIMMCKNMSDPLKF